MMRRNQSIKGEDVDWTDVWIGAINRMMAELINNKPPWSPTGTRGSSTFLSDGLIAPLLLDTTEDTARHEADLNTDSSDQCRTERCGAVRHPDSFEVVTAGAMAAADCFGGSRGQRADCPAT